MKKAFIVFALTFNLLSIESKAQTTTVNSNQLEPSIDDVYDVVEQSPEFPGGINKFGQFVYTNFRFPEGITENIRINVTFVVERDGTLSNIKLLKDPGYGVADEVVRVLSKSPKWKPGYQKGKPVKTLYHFPVTLRFE